MNKKTLLIFSMVIALLLFGAGCTILEVTEAEPMDSSPVDPPSPVTLDQPEETAVLEPDAIIPEPVVEPPKVEEPTVEEPKTVSIAANCNTFPGKLSSCSAYKCQFLHPFTGSNMEKEVVGIVNGKCKYVEQMPNNGKMECNYTELQRTTAANYYTAAAAGTSVGGSVNIDLGTGETETTSTVNDEVVENPLQTYLEDGTCVISGY
jgi:hypothetical protein